MRARQIVNLAPDRTHLVAYTTVKAHTLVKDHIAHGLLLDAVIVALYKRSLFLKLLLRNGSEKFLLDGGKAVFAFVL